MAKDAYYFSHDSNARNDEKILSLRMQFGMEGYGIYWAIIEMLRDSTDYRMQTQFERIAFELHADSVRVESILQDFELFESDGEYFWSESLLRRMQIKEEKSKKASLSAKSRWDKAKAVRTHSEGSANGMQGKERKVKETKEKNIIPPPLDLIFSYSKIRGNNVDVNKFFNFYESKNWMIGKNKMKDWQAAYRTWEPQIKMKPKAKTPF